MGTMICSVGGTCTVRQMPSPAWIVNLLMTMSKIRPSALVQLRLDAFEQRNMFGALATDIAREKAVWQFQERPGQACTPFALGQLSQLWITAGSQSMECPQRMAMDLRAMGIVAFSEQGNQGHTGGVGYDGDSWTGQSPPTSLWPVPPALAFDCPAQARQIAQRDSEAGHACH